MKISKSLKFALLTAVIILFVGCITVLSFNSEATNFLMHFNDQSVSATNLANPIAENRSHRLLVSGSSHERIGIIDFDGTTIWELKGLDTLWTEVNDAEMASNGDIVYTARNSFSPSGSFVRRISPNYKTGGYSLVWEYSVPSGGENHTCQILENDKVLICETYSDHIRIAELDKNGKLSRLIGDNGEPKDVFNTNVGSHNQLRQITKTQDGTYLLTHFTNDVTYEINDAGEIVKTYPFGKGFAAVKDKDGNVIITGGNQSVVKAFASNGKELWNISKNDVEGVTLGFPAGVIPLENGNIILANWGGHGGTAGVSPVVEINPVSKELVWAMDTEDSYNISNIFGLDNFDFNIDTESENYRSPIDVVANSTTNSVFVADYTNKTISVINSFNDCVVANFDLPNAPNALVASKDGSKLYVACGEENGEVAVVDVETGKVKNTINVGYSPSSITFGESESTLYVANRFDSTVTKIQLTADGINGNVTTSEKITKEPIAISYASDKIFVAGHLPNVAATEEVVSSEVCILNPNTLMIEKTLKLTNGSTDLKDMSVSPDGKYIYVTHTLGRYWVATTQVDRGWIYTNAVTEINASTKEIAATMLLDDVDMGAGNPWGIAVTNDKLVVSTAGTGEIITIDRNEMRSRLDGVASGKYTSADGSVKTIDDIPNSLTFLSDIKQRISLNTSGTKGIAILNNKVYAANYYSSSVSVVDAVKSKKSKDIVFKSSFAESSERAGERIWNDATLCYGMWQSCASCHPDARADGLNWDNMNDGIGVNKQARSMIDTFARGRVMATGIRPNAETAVKAGMKYIMFNNGITDEQFEQINAYLKSLMPAPSPELKSDGTLTESAKRGKTLFEGIANCTSCHSNEIFGKDELVYDMYKNDKSKEQRGLLIPPLREVWRTGPYLHDGSAATIEDVLQSKIKSGNTKLAVLSENELEDLANYVMSIGDDNNAQNTFIPGDINGDAITDLNDVVTLAKFLAGWKDVNYVAIALDTNGDEKINLNDLVILAQYVAGWEGVELSGKPYLQ